MNELDLHDYLKDAKVDQTLAYVCRQLCGIHDGEANQALTVFKIAYELQRPGESFTDFCIREQDLYRGVMNKIALCMAEFNLRIEFHINSIMVIL